MKTVSQLWQFVLITGSCAGLYQTATGDLLTASVQKDFATGNKFGFAPKIGFEYGHFHTPIEYNVAGKTGNVNNSY